MKRFFKALALGVCIGLLASAVQIIFKIDHDVLVRYYFILTGILLAAVVLFNLLYVGKYRKKIFAAVKLLDAGKAQEYLNEIEALRQQTKSRGMKTLLKLNLTPGYCDLKEYDRAIEILTELSHERLWGITAMVQKLNLCACYFYTNQNEKAMALYWENQKLFAPYQKSSFYGGHLAVIELFALICQEQYEKADALLKNAKKQWPQPRLQDDYQHIQTLLKEKRPEKSTSDVSENKEIGEF